MSARRSCGQGGKVALLKACCMALQSKVVEVPTERGLKMMGMSLSSLVCFSLLDLGWL